MSGHFFQHHCHVHASVARVACPGHGVRQIDVPYAKGEPLFLPVRAGGDDFGAGDAGQRRGARIMQITCKRGHNYITVFIDMQGCET